MTEDPGHQPQEFSRCQKALRSQAIRIRTRPNAVAHHTARHATNPWGDLHYPECDWQPYRRPYLPAPPEPMVQDARRHLPGRRNAQPRTRALFIEVTQCVVCGAVDTCESQIVPSYGGTTEYWYRCTSCDTRWSNLDLSAVI